MTITERMVPIACQLAGHVRAHDKRAIFNLIRDLTPNEAYALVVVLAAMIPTDHTAGQLLAWTEQLPTRAANARVVALRPCGTHAAYWRHKANNEPPCADCRQAERAYQRERKQRRHGAA
jgi:hypothetical protein